MSTPYLTETEVREIAAPLTQPAAIVRWFRSNGFDAKIRPNGMPLVTRANFEAVTNSTPTINVNDAINEAPDVAGYLLNLNKKAKSKSLSQKA